MKRIDSKNLRWRKVLLLLFYFALTSFSATGQVVIQRFACTEATSSTFIYDEIKADKSDGYCDTGTRLQAVVTSGSHLVSSAPTVTRLDGGPHRAQVNIAWATGQTGVLTVDVFYEKRIYKGFPSTSCKWTSWRKMYTYQIYRQPMNPGGIYQGTTTAFITNEATVSAFDLTYKPSDPYFLNERECSRDATVPFQSCGLKATKIQYNTGRDQNGDGSNDWVEKNIIFDRGNYIGVPVTYYATGSGDFYMDVKVWVETNGDCGIWRDIPPKMVTVKSNCYTSDFSGVTIDIPSADDKSHDDHQVFKVEQDVAYTLTVTGITDFDTHYSWNFADFGQDVTVNGNSFTPLKKGSYTIHVNPQYADCPTPDPVDILVDTDDLIMTQDCSIQLPADINNFYPEIFPTDVVLEHFSAYVQSKTAIVVMPGVSLELGAELFIEPGIAEPTTDLQVNFTEKSTFNEYGEVLGTSRSYFNERGLPIQVQRKNLTQDVILGTSTLYDALARPAVSTLLAPVNTTNIHDCPEDQVTTAKKEFQYHPGFLKAEGQDYDHLKFDLTKEYNPDPLDNTEEGTLGWYYSSNNGTSSNTEINEPQVATTQFPYSRTLYRNDGSGAVKGVTKPGDKFRAGTGFIATATDEPVAVNDPFFDASDKSYLTIRQRDLGLPRPESISGQFFKKVVIDETGKKSVAYSDKAGNLIIDVYYGTGSTAITTSFHFYDVSGRKVLDISPNGFNQYTFNTTTLQSNLAEIDKTHYEYNSKGLLSAVEEKTAGQETDGISRTEYLYRKDGKIRFSQNELQRNASPQRYSYTNYERSGRPIESGEYEVGTGGVAFAWAEQKEILESVAEDGGLSELSGTKFDRTFTFYDEHDTNIPVNRNQRFVHGAVASTSNDDVKTWYSYDEKGRIEWMVQDITGFGIKTIDYRYGPTGQAQEVIYQKDNPEERFTHYYEYNPDGKLYRTYTSRDELVYDVYGRLANANVTYNADGYIDNPGILEHQATYYYYLHGSLKRVELAARMQEGTLVTLQGIDYTYTADGSLKAINGADKSLDGDADGAGINGAVKSDVFGMTLDYYAGDYAPAQGQTDAASYSGTYVDQPSGLIKGMRWHSPIEPNKQFGYAYTYDERNQFTKADWGAVTAGSFAANPAKPYHEVAGGYDDNGNIASLQRNGNVLDPTTSFKQDFTYVYKPNTNMLATINDQSPSGVFRSYTYDDVGQMTRETEGDKSKYVEYNVTGKVTAVYSDENHTQPVARFRYDDRGFRLSKDTYDENHALALTTWYVRDASGNIVSTYETDHAQSGEAKATEVPVYGAGRLGMYKPNFDVTFYELTDHLGNVRAVIGDDLEMEYMATMESERGAEEQQDFQNVNPVPTAEYINHTPGEVVVDGETFIIPNNNEVCRLNNRPSGVVNPKPIGTGIMLLVHPGDVINAEVFAKYANFDAGNTNILTGLASFLASTFTAAPVVDGVSLFNVVNTPEFAALPVWSGLDETAPQAFLNYLLFDKDFKLQTNGFDFDQVSSAAEITVADPFAHDHERLTLNVTVEKEGFIYIYVSNDSDQDMDVYFDDLRIEHQYSNIVAGGDYYPFGLSMQDRTISRENYRFGYQGQFAEKDIETEWNHFDLREYDATIGRWTTTDPLQQYWSQYLGMGNDPVNSVDPDGAFKNRFGAWLYARFHKGGDIERASSGEWYVGNHSNSDAAVTYTRVFDWGTELDHISVGLGGSGRYSLGPQIAYYTNGSGGEVGVMSAELVEVGFNISYSFKNGWAADGKFDFLGQDGEAEFISRAGASSGGITIKGQHELTQSQYVGRSQQGSVEVAHVSGLYAKQVHGWGANSGREIGIKRDLSVGLFGVVDLEGGFNVKY